MCLRTRCQPTAREWIRSICVITTHFCIGWQTATQELIATHVIAQDAETLEGVFAQTEHLSRRMNMSSTILVVHRHRFHRKLELKEMPETYYGKSRLYTGINMMS